MRMYKQGMVNYFPGQINISVERIIQAVKWRIRDFPEVPIPEEGVPTYYLANLLPKTALKMKEISLGSVHP